MTDLGQKNGMQPACRVCVAAAPSAGAGGADAAGPAARPRGMVAGRATGMLLSPPPPPPPPAPDSTSLTLAFFSAAI